MGSNGGAGVADRAYVTALSGERTGAFYMQNHKSGRSLKHIIPCRHSADPKQF